MTRFFAWVFFGSFVVACAITLIAPNVISWYAKPPIPIGVSCDEGIRWANAKLVLTQGIGAAMGATLGAVFSIRTKKPSNN
jgi:hypothetical protein